MQEGCEELNVVIGAKGERSCEGKTGSKHGVILRGGGCVEEKKYQW